MNVPAEVNVSNTKSAESRDERPFVAAILGRINRFVSRRGIAQAELARRVDLSKQSVSRLLRGQQTLTVGHVLDFAAALEVSPEELFGVDASPEPAEAQLLAALRTRDATRVADALAGLGINLRPAVRANPSSPEEDRVERAARRIRESADSIQTAADVLREAADALVDDE